MMIFKKPRLACHPIDSNNQNYYNQKQIMVQNHPNFEVPPR